jgi:hypothetical protein
LGNSPDETPEVSLNEPDEQLAIEALQYGNPTRGLGPRCDIVALASHSHPNA